MSFITRVGFVLALVCSMTGHAWADNGDNDIWPKPFGHDTEGGLLDNIDAYGRVDFELDVTDADEVDQSRAGIISGRLGASLQATDYLAAFGEIRTGNDFRNARVDFGGGNFDQNFDLSISQLGFRYQPEVPIEWIPDFTLAVGRQALNLPGNWLYNGSVFDEDLSLDGVQLNWDCDCEEWNYESGVSVGGWKLNRVDEQGFANPDGLDTETARLLTIGTYSRWTPVEYVEINPFVNYYRYSNITDGFGEDAFGNPSQARLDAGIVDTPDILHAGLNTTFRLWDVPITLSGEYIHDLDANDDEVGWTGGIGFDFPACDRLHRVSYLYQDIGAWSVVPGYTQDDHRSARAGFTGHVVQGTFNTTDRVSLNLEAFTAEESGDGPDFEDEWRIRAGLRMNFN